MPNLLGTGPSQVPTNADLGKLAFMDVVDTVTNNPYLDTAISDTKPSLLLDFANSKTLDPRITYTRASTATYYDGKTTAVAEQNLLTYSQDFSNAAWTKSGVSVTANTATAPDGSATAETVAASSSNAGYVGQLFSGTTGLVYTFSFYVKNIDSTQSRLLIRNASTVVDGFINWTGATLTSITQNNGTTSFIDVGNGWYRVWSTYTAIEATQLGRILPDMSAGTQSVYIWGAQLEQRSSVSAYTPTTNSPITNYIPALQTAAAGVPRFDHDPVTGESKGFLIEEQRTNLLTYSADFSNAAWTKTRTTVTADTVVAPDGTLTGDKLVEDTTATSTHSLYSRPSITSGTTYSLSVYAKAGGRNRLVLQQFNSATAYASTVIDLANAYVVITSGTGASATITHVGNGWYRCNLVGVADATATGYAQVSLAQDGYSTAGSQSYTGDGYSGIYIWGAQLEAGSFATSYIPTTSAQVTRSADAASMTGSNFSSWYRADEGTLYGDFKASAVGALVGLGTDTGCIYYNPPNVSWWSGSAILNCPGASADFNKVGAAYSTNGRIITINGNSPVTVTTTLINGGTLMIGRNFVGTANFLNGTIKRIAYYPKRLSDAELQEMTL